MDLPTFWSAFCFWVSTEQLLWFWRQVGVSWLVSWKIKAQGSNNLPFLSPAPCKSCVVAGAFNSWAFLMCVQVKLTSLWYFLQTLGLDLSSAEFLKFLCLYSVWSTQISPNFTADGVCVLFWGIIIKRRGLKSVYFAIFTHLNYWYYNFIRNDS